MRAVSAHSALLGTVSDKEMYEIVKLSYTRIFPSYIVLHKVVKALYKKIGILLFGHIKLTLGLIPEGSQARNELQIFKVL